VGVGSGRPGGSCKSVAAAAVIGQLPHSHMEDGGSRYPTTASHVG